jgi:hypothetical protein
MLLDTQVYRAGRHNSPCIMYKLLTSSAPPVYSVHILNFCTDTLAGILLLCLHLIISIYDQGAVACLECSLQQ